MVGWKTRSLEYKEMKKKQGRRKITKGYLNGQDVGWCVTENLINK